MTSILKADEIQDSSGNLIIKEVANAITIGASGDAITVPSGATLTAPGHILQVVSATDSTSRSTTSTSFVTGSNTMSVSITPASTSNKIFVMATGNIYMGTSAAYVIATIYRDSTDLGAGSDKGLTNLYKNPDDVGAPLAMSVLDSPSSTSALTYQVYFRVTAGTGNINENGTKGVITAFEVAG
jgi:hypothetical protein